VYQEAIIDITPSEWVSEWVGCLAGGWVRVQMVSEWVSECSATIPLGWVDAAKLTSVTKANKWVSEWVSKKWEWVRDSEEGKQQQEQSVQQQQEKKKVCKISGY
jgi:hypothetical protein